jgi:hypothetical protein
MWNIKLGAARVLDMMTGRPKSFPSKDVAKTYAKLSCFAGYDIVKAP